MKVKIGPYKNWFGPYHLAEKILFFIPKKIDKHGFKRSANFVHKFGEKLSEIDWLNDFFVWIHSKRKRKEYIRIDSWDTWNMDDTLSIIILPMLKQLKESKHGAPFVDLDDVPEELHPTQEEIEKQKIDGTTDEKFFARWDYVLNEMIFAFENHIDNSWEKEFRKGEIDFNSVPCEWDEEGNPTLYSFEEGPNHTYECDYGGMKKVQDRIDNGFKLFGKYYRSLWD